MDGDQQPVLMPVSRPISLVPVGLKEAALDSPSFRANILHFGTQVDSVERWLEGLVKAVGKLSQDILGFEIAINACLNCAAPPNELSEAVLDHDYTVLAAQRYGDIAKDYWHLAIAGIKKMENNMVTPIKSFLNEDLRRFKELQRNVEHSQRIFDGLQSRYAGQAKTKEASALREDAFQLYESRKVYLKASMDYSTQAPTIRASLDKLLVKVFCDQAQTITKSQNSLSFSKWSSDLERVRGWSREMENSERVFRRDIQNARRSIEDNVETITKPSRELDDYSQSSVPAMLAKGPTSAMPTSIPKSAERQGWLFLRTLTGKPSRFVWVRRWFYVKNGIFGWLVQGSRSGGVEESDRIGVLLCGLRPAPQEERRFCFEVKTKDATFVLQAESQNDLVHWLGTFDQAKQKALEDPTSTDSFSNLASQALDPAFAISPPSAPEFTASAADAGTHAIAEEGHDKNPSLTLLAADTSNLAHRGSFDVSAPRKATGLDKDPVPESNRERLKQKLDLRKTSTGLAGQGPSASSGIASLISASHASLPVGPGVVSSTMTEAPGPRPTVTTSKTAYLARTLPPSSLAPSTLAAPPMSTNLSGTAVAVNGERGIGIGRSDDTGGMPSGILANLWGSSNWGYINRFERGEVASSKEGKPANVPSPTSPAQAALNLAGTENQTAESKGQSAEPATQNTVGVDAPPLHRKTISLNGDAAELQRAAIAAKSPPREFPNYYPVQLKHQDAQFRLLFPNVKKEEKLVLVFRATWNPNDEQEFPGRVYVTPRHVYFYSNHLGLVLVSGVDISSISEVTAATGHDCDFLYMHFNSTTGRPDQMRITVKTFLDPLRLLQRRLNFLVENSNSEYPEDLETIMKTLIKMESDVGQRSPSQESWDETYASADENKGPASQRNRDLRARITVDQGLSTFSRAVNKEGFKFKLPNKPVLYVPRGMSQPSVEREFDISPKALFHVLFGDRSAVWQLLYHEHQARSIKQEPWKQEAADSHMRRAFEYTIDATTLLGRSQQLIVTDTQIIDVLNDHLCYVVTDRKTPWHLPYHDDYILSSKIVITHVTKSKCKLAIFTNIEWRRKPLLTSTLIEQHARSDLQLDALDLVDVIAEQVRKLGAQSQTKKAVQIFGHVGQQTQTIELLDSSAALSGQIRRSSARRTMPRLLLDASRSLSASILSTVLIGTLTVFKWIFKTINTNSVVILLLTLSILVNALYSSRETSGWWQERHARQYMRQLGVGKDLVMSKAIHITDLDDVVSFSPSIEQDPLGQCLETFKSVALEESSSSSEPTVQRLKRSRQQLGEHRHDLVVAMRVVNKIEKEMIQAGWEDWVHREADKCDRMVKMLGREDANATWSQNSDTVRAQFTEYCSSCNDARRNILTDGNRLLG